MLRQTPIRPLARAGRAESQPFVWLVLLAPIHPALAGLSGRGRATAAECRDGRRSLWKSFPPMACLVHVQFQSSAPRRVLKCPGSPLNYKN